MVAVAQHTATHKSDNRIITTTTTATAAAPITIREPIVRRTNESKSFQCLAFVKLISAVFICLSLCVWFDPFNVYYCSHVIWFHFILVFVVFFRFFPQLRLRSSRDIIFDIADFPTRTVAADVVFRVASFILVKHQKIYGHITKLSFAIRKYTTH